MIVNVCSSQVARNIVFQACCRDTMGIHGPPREKWAEENRETKKSSRITKVTNCNGLRSSRHLGEIGGEIMWDAGKCLGLAGEPCFGYRLDVVYKVLQYWGVVWGQISKDGHVEAFTLRSTLEHIGNIWVFEVILQVSNRFKWYQACQHQIPALHSWTCKI